MYAGVTAPQMLQFNPTTDPLSSLMGTQFYGQAMGQQQQNYGAYKNAFNSLQGMIDPSLQNFDTQTRNEQQGLLGSLNARGLAPSILGSRMPGSSSPISGNGSGALQNLAQQRLLGRNQMEQGFAGQLNGLNNSFLGNTNSLLNGYNQLGLQQRQLAAQEQQNQINPINILTTGISLAGLF